MLEPIIDVPRDLVWRAWTVPEKLKRWLTPVPRRTVECDIDLRPGGIFRTVMRGPEGQEFSNAGGYLKIVPNEKLVWTGALAPGYRPRSAKATSAEPFLMTAVISLEPHGAGTKYTALVIHGDEESRKQHEQMGFHQGWGKALDQLVAMIKAR